MSPWTELATLYLTHFDSQRLNALLEAFNPTDEHERVNVERLRDDLDRAMLVDSAEVPPDVVTMNSTVTVRDEADRSRTFTLVFPGGRARSSPVVSILAPLGAAVLGYRVGDLVRWTAPGGSKNWRIDAISYQPEAAGQFHL